jgi:predicted nucleotide-binding protein
VVRLEPSVADRIVAAAATGGSEALDRVIEVWEHQFGTRQGLTDALLELQQAGRLELETFGQRDAVSVRRILAVQGPQQAPARPPSNRGPIPVARDSRSVFVVHGRDERLRASLFTFLRALDLRPIEWSDLVREFGEGAPYIGELLDRAFELAQAVVVLMTPDENVELVTDLAGGRPELGYQAPPNVLFEAGMALGRAPSRTIIVEVGELRPFSDVAGRHVVRLNDEDVRGAVGRRQDLARRLESVGCPVQLAGTDWHIAGEFTARSPGHD